MRLKKLSFAIVGCLASLTLVGCGATAVPQAGEGADDSTEARRRDMRTPPPHDMATPQDLVTPGACRLRFAAFGDTRPAVPGGTYPTAVVESVFRAIDRLMPQLVVLSGDYIFVSGTDPTQAAAQMDTFLTARKQLSPLIPVHYILGNHEDKNIPTFQSKLSANTYWSFTQCGAKFVGIANDAWDSTQAAWLTSELAKPSKYTFVFRHQYWGSHGVDPNNDAAMQKIVTAHPYTLFIAGHDHAYKHKTTITRGDARDVIAGNGGAPFDATFTNPFHGFILVEQQSNDDIKVTAYKADPGLDVPPVVMDTWSVKP